MKFILQLAVIMAVIGQFCVMADCGWGKKYHRSKEYKQKAAGFYKAIMNERPSAVTLLKVLHDQNFLGEEAIAIVDKDFTCTANHDEFMGFLEKWARKKHQKLSEKSRKFAEKAFTFIDDNHDGVIDPFEMHYALTEIV